MKTKPRYVRTPRFTKSEWIEVVKTMEGAVHGQTMANFSDPIAIQIDAMPVGGYLEYNRAMIRALRKIFC